MLGLEFMSNGIQALAVNKMQALLAKIAGTPIKGVLAGTAITGVIQSSTAMTVMVVGLVNAGVIGLRPAISVIMGANIGTTLGNGLIALPLGPLGLILGGIFALVYVFAKTEKIKNIALACMGFALIFYGLNLMTGGLRPLRNMPEVMSVISNLRADTYMGLVYCLLIAAFITALIHSSSATIGIVMGLGSAGVLDWQTAVAFSLGADLGTTITSWMASLNLSKNAKRAAYAHISFNIIGVAVMLPLFFPSMIVLASGDAVVRWRSRRPGRRQRQGHLPAGAGGDRPLLDLLQHLQHRHPVPVRRRVRAGAARRSARMCRTNSRIIRRRAISIRTTRKIRRRLCRRSSAKPPAISTRPCCSSISPRDTPTRRTTRSNTARPSTCSAAKSGNTAGLFDPNMPHDRADLVASLIEKKTSPPISVNRSTRLPVVSSVIPSPMPAARS